ncbi:MAG: AAA family ATPase [Propylenella sp.]
MKTIAFVAQKGGSGKSTLCIGLAVAARETGSTVCMIEMDRQATVSDWAEIRKSEPPEVAQVDATEIAAVLTRLSDCRYDYAFIDTPGAIGPETLAAIRAADICIVPSRPTPADFRAIRPTLAAIYRMEKRFAFVLNQTPANGCRVREAADGLIALGVLPDVNIVLRNDHQDALGAGQGVTEFNPGGKAADEIRRLWRWVSARADASGRSAAVRTRLDPEPHVRAA